MRGFLGFPLEESFGERLAALVAGWKAFPDLKPVPRPDLHLTVKFLGEFSTVEFHRHLDEVRALGPPPAAAFTAARLAVWPTVLVLECAASEGAMEWQRRWNETLERKGFLKERHPRFRPHVTLARWKGETPPAGLAAAVELCEHQFAGSSLPIEPLALYQSQAEETGRRHRPFLTICFPRACGT